MVGENYDLREGIGPVDTQVQLVIVCDHVG